MALRRTTTPAGSSSRRRPHAGCCRTRRRPPPCSAATLWRRSPSWRRVPRVVLLGRVQGRCVPVDVDALVLETVDLALGAKPALAVNGASVLVAKVARRVADRLQLVGNAVVARDGYRHLALREHAGGHLSRCSPSPSRRCRSGHRSSLLATGSSKAARSRPQLPNGVLRT